MIIQTCLLVIRFILSNVVQNLRSFNGVNSKVLTDNPENKFHYPYHSQKQKNVFGTIFAYNSMEL